MQKTESRILALFLSLTLALGFLPLPAAAADPVTVQVQFDLRSIGSEEVLADTFSDCPADVTVSVPEGSTVYTVLEAAKAEGEFQIGYNETNSYVKSIGSFADGAAGAQALCIAMGATYSSVFQYAGWMYSGDGLTGWGIQSDTVSQDCAITFRYTVYIDGTTWVNRDWEFVDAYDALSAAIPEAQAMNNDDGSYTEEQWATLQTAISDAQSALTGVDTEEGDLAAGKTLNYLAAETTSLWGTGSPTEQLETARTELNRAVNRIVTPTGVTVSPAEGVSIPLNRTYQLSPSVLPADAPQAVTYEAESGGDSFTVSSSGLITPKAICDACCVKITSQEEPSVSATFTFQTAAAVSTASVDADVAALLTNISASYTEAATDWPVMDLGAYHLLNADGAALTENAKQSYVNSAWEAVTADSAGDAAYSKAILALCSMGVDPEKLYPVNSNEPVNVVEKLKATATNSIYTAPYVLLAYQQGDWDTAGQEQEVLSFILSSQNPDGSWGSIAWGYDTTAMVLQGLAAYDTGSRTIPGDTDFADSLRTAVDKGVACLQGVVTADGTLPNSWDAAYTDAEAVLGLCALGVDPGSFAQGDGASLLTGMLSAANETDTGFLFGDSVNAGTTERAFRALIAYQGYATAVEAAGEAAVYNVYDFTTLTKTSARVTGSPASDTSDPGDDEETITATFTLKADTGYWISGKRLTLEEGDTVYDAFIQALATGFTYTGASSGYVSSITQTSTGKTLSDEDAENSGWLYKVNGELPSAGLTDYVLSDGDVIVWYYTEDWTKDPSASAYENEPEGIVVTYRTGTGGRITFTVQEDGKTVTEVSGGVQTKLRLTGSGTIPVLVNEDGSETVVRKSYTDGTYLYLVLPGSCTVELRDAASEFGDVAASDWFAESAEFAADRGLLRGVSDTEFAPATPMSRAMLSAVLYRLEGEPDYEGTGAFDDVAAGTWYTDSVNWAAGLGIVQGTSAGLFAPADPINREQTAVLLWRYAQAEGLDTSGQSELSGYSDEASVSDWAREAVAWCVDAGLLTGKDGGRLDPQGITTRAEAAELIERLCADLTGAAA